MGRAASLSTVQTPFSPYIILSPIEYIQKNPYPITYTYILHDISAVFKGFLRFDPSNFMSDISRKSKNGAREQLPICSLFSLPGYDTINTLIPGGRDGKDRGRF